MNRPSRSRMRRIEESSTATTLELFFDLVFVFALTQVTQLMAHEPDWTGLLRGVLLLAVVWWCWIVFSWTTNLVKADEGPARIVMLSAMAGMFLIAIAIPEAFHDIPGGLDGPMLFAFCYLVVRLIHLVLFWNLSREDPVLRKQTARFLPTVVLATGLLLIASQTSGNAQLALWGGAVLADYGGTLVIGGRGWRLNSPRHFAERYGLIVIIALGESLVAIGVGVNELAISWPIVIAALLGLLLSAALWWAYFDTFAYLAEHALASAEGVQRPLMARMVFTYLHLPMIVGVVMLALGLKKTLNYVSGVEGHTLADHLHGPPLWALTGGVSLYLLAHVACTYRCVGALKTQRLVLALALIPLTFVFELLPALATLAAVAALMVALIGYEWVVYREQREKIRHAHAEH